LLCRANQVWTLQTHRLQPDTPADPGKPAQTVTVGGAPRGGPKPGTNAVPAAADTQACLIVSPSRDWLGVCGLPAPQPAVLRGPIAGARIGAVSARACPVLAPGQRLSAATISMAEEFVLFTADPAGRVLVADTRGGQLLVFGADPLIERQAYPVDESPYGIAGSTTLVWVSQTATNTVIGYDLATGIPMEKVRYPTVRQPNSLALDQDSGTLYVVSGSGDGVQMIRNAAGAR
jgi:hypothetical protein